MSLRHSIEDARPEDRHRLPLLIEVLSRRTLAPVDLFSFYIYMRDQQRSVDYLDFWLDVQQHLAICRHYVRELRRTVLQEQAENDKAASKQSQLLEQFGESHTNGDAVSEKSQEQAISAILRSDRGESATKNSHSHKDSQESSGNSRGYPRSNGNGTGQSYVSSALQTSSSEEHHDSSPEHEVSRADIRAHAERILYTYLLPGAEREIILPPQLLNEITEAIEDNLRDDPEVFDAAKEYVFLAMERDAFPGFLRARALGNLNPPHLLLRLVFGLLSLFGAFWTSFALVFLDYSHALRAWVVLPYWFGVYSLVSHQYTLDPLFAFVGYSEYTFANFTRMREPFVMSLLRKRALIELLWIIVIVAALSCLFIFVPGHRL